MVKVSVIIPVYNAEKYLRECLSSLEDQTLKDIEIICVDDGSTDDSLDILNEYSERDPRFIILRQKNKFAGIARNNGIDHASGEYCIFLDADDFFEKDLLAKTYHKIKEDSADIVLFNGDEYETNQKVYRKTNGFLRTDKMPDKIPFSAEENKEHIFDMVLSCPWTKLYSLEFINRARLRFQGTRNANDVKFVLLSLAAANKITVLNEILVHYRIGMDSNLQANKHRSPFDFYEAYSALKKELEEKGLFKTYKKSYLNIVVTSCLHNLKFAKNEEMRSKILDRLEEILINLELSGYTEEEFYNKNAYKELNGFLAEAKQAKKLKEEIKLYSKRSGYPANPEITVIIPVYNSSEYLEKCLKNVKAQTYTNIEIICINDGSTDNSLDILEKCAGEDKRISIISRENKGISAAVNDGIKIARGKYLYYLHSDEIIKNDAVEKLYMHAGSGNLDLLFFNGDLRYEPPGLAQKYPSSEKYCKSKVNYKDVYTGRRLYIKMVNDGEYGISSCIRFVKTEFSRDINIEFYAGNAYEDNIYTFACMMKAERAGYFNETLFEKIIREDTNKDPNFAYKQFCSYFISLLYIAGERGKYKNDENLIRAIDNRIYAVYQSAYEKYLLLSEKEKKILPEDGSYAVMTHKMLFRIPTAVFEKYNKDHITKYIANGSNSDYSTGTGSPDTIYTMLNNTAAELRSIQNSLSYKAGRLLTWLPRKLRGGIMCFKEHGVGYTVKRTLQHFAGKTR